MDPRVMSRREENAAETRRALVENAAKLFAGQGYAKTSLDQVAVLARVTKGAVYHHFTNKQALFGAVLELVDERTVAAIATTASSANSPWDAALAGLDAFLDRCLDPDYQQICFRDGPTALGFVQWWEHGERHVEGVLTAALTALRADRSIVTADVDALGTALYGALTAAALTIARAEDAREARNTMGRTMLELLAGLRPAAS
ncbi:TetR/AcrR family transcriptional regulator [Nocardia vaccinii]|uniref:TetR/AcrR family transcriptional regulator n=1 Tax=Nocardia vaccinii TaxID=1822 RepID=UPI00082F5457|nr:TetR/AcrR family transcriptional regulator [Nocardia vaccinii]